MPCFSPLKGYRAAVPNENGRRPIVFNVKDAFVDMPVELPCGQCIGCRLERSRQWAMRCVHEASLYEDNCFLTLTYDNEHLPLDGSLNKRHFQLFMKRLRKKYGSNIRFYHCGEYGEVCSACGKSRVYCLCSAFVPTIGRPHYHACIFNHDFTDKVLHSVRNNNNLYTSDSLSDLWPMGFSSRGDLTFESAAYCARYIMKKVTGDAGPSHYEVVDPGTGEVFNLEPEYTTMSRRPGIATGWFEKFSSDVYPSDEVIMRGRSMKPPKFYDRILQKQEENNYINIRGIRVRRARVHEQDNTPERLRVRERVQLSKLKQLKRTLE